MHCARAMKRDAIPNRRLGPLVLVGAIASYLCVGLALAPRSSFAEPSSETLVRAEGTMNDDGVTFEVIGAMPPGLDGGGFGAPDGGTGPLY